MIRTSLARLTSACCDGHTVRLYMRGPHFCCEVTAQNMTAVGCENDLDAAILSAVNAAHSFIGRSHVIDDEGQPD